MTSIWPENARYDAAANRFLESVEICPALVQAQSFRHAASIAIVYGADGMIR